LDIGSYYTPGFAALCDRRRFFPGQPYVGCDIRPGPGVDRIEDAEHLSFADQSLRSVLLLETLEHVPRPQRVVSEVQRVLHPEGVALVSVPFDYRIHGWPTDFWRFTAAGLNAMLSGFPQRAVCAVGPQLRPSQVFAVVASRRPSFEREAARWRREVDEAFRRHRWRHALKVLEERGRDFMGLLLGRAAIGVAHYDPRQAGGYRAGDDMHV
jgi:SAM-dependent methyltransferase